ncbi:MAG: SPOR domain-containing protein [Bacteroides sp.]|nr:SPOR domain-containing protein [Roseburia sp.]MCM1345682.1 SPOR domain-containing protein [Bacteroides sp.]MCM1420435.1 SPOR domain-containing protein [Bacteroides sp.]
MTFNTYGLNTMYRKYSFSIACLFLLSIPAVAQTNFMEHLESKVNGQGTVTVLQDQRLTNIINGDAALNGNVGQQQTQTGEEEDLPVVNKGTKVKVRGYRIQVYWGGSQRTDQSRAQHAGTMVTTAFPELQAYTSFVSPHWRCRVGDFTTRQEAAEYLKKLCDMNMGSDAMIVRSEIYVYK